MIQRSTRGYRAHGPKAALALGLSLALGAGCGGTSVTGLVPAKGRVTLDGGPWPREGTVSLMPVSARGGEFRPVAAKFDTQGNFSASAFDGAPGVYPGTYKLGVECLDGEPGMDAQGKPTGKNIVPAKYQSASTSGFSFEVKPEGTVDPVFDVKTK